MFANNSFLDAVFRRRMGVGCVVFGTFSVFWILRKGGSEMEDKELIEHLSTVLETELMLKNKLFLARERVKVFEAETFLRFKKENLEGGKRRTEKEIDAEVVLDVANSKESKEYVEVQSHYLETEKLVEVVRAMIAFALRERK